MNIRKILVPALALMMSTFLAHGMNFNHMTKDKLNATLIAEYEAGNFGYAMELIRAGADMQALLNQGKDVNATGRLGSTLLHWAIFYGYADEAEFLMAAGANPFIKNDNGSTPLDFVDGIVQNRFDSLRNKHQQLIAERDELKAKLKHLKKWAQENPGKAQAVKESYQRRLEEYKKLINTLKVNQKRIENCQRTILVLNPWIEEFNKQKKQQKEDIINTYKTQRNAFKVNTLEYFQAHLPPQNQMFFKEQEVRQIFSEVEKAIEATRMTSFVFVATGITSIAVMAFLTWNQKRTLNLIAQTATQNVETMLAIEFDVFEANSSLLTLQEQFDIDSLLRVVKSNEKRQALKVAIEEYDTSFKEVRYKILSPKYCHQTPAYLIKNEQAVIQQLRTHLDVLTETVLSCQLDMNLGWKKLFGFSGVLAGIAGALTWYNLAF